ncbi:hypothetical protein ScPMuIL_012369 [Solemya velum]
MKLDHLIPGKCDPVSPCPREPVTRAPVPPCPRAPVPPCHRAPVAVAKKTNFEDVWFVVSDKSRLCLSLTDKSLIIHRGFYVQCAQVDLYILYGVVAIASMSKYSLFALLLFPVLGYVGAKKGGERVLLDDIATASDFTAEMLLGKWYARKINYGANLPTKLAMLEIYQGRGDLLHHRLLLHVPETDTCRVQDKLLSPSCGEYIGEFNLGHPSRKAPGRWGSYKVLTLTDTVLAMLVCFKEKMDGTCDKSGLHGAIWSREPKQPIKHFGTLKQLYRDVGFDNNNWETPTDGVCNEALLDGPKYVDSGNNSLECRAMDVPSVPGFSPSGVNGYWYTIAHLGPATTASYRYRGEFEGSVGITTAGLK